MIAWPIFMMAMMMMLMILLMPDPAASFVPISSLPSTWVDSSSCSSSVSPSMSTSGIPEIGRARCQRAGTAFRQTSSSSLAARRISRHVDDFQNQNLKPSRATTTISIQGVTGRDGNGPDAGPSRRRAVLQRLAIAASAAVVFGSSPPPSHGVGEIGARVTEAVTTSGLGLSVRTSVVRGAQVIDRLDGRWERFSDRYGLGTERSKQSARPAPRAVVNPLPLDVGVAGRLLEASDWAFLTATGVRPSRLRKQVADVGRLVRPSFERAAAATGRREASADLGPPTPSTANDDDGDVELGFHDARGFNFVAYSHFRAYSDLLVQDGVPFGPFRPKFERLVGQRLVGGSDGGDGDGGTSNSDGKGAAVWSIPAGDRDGGSGGGSRQKGLEDRLISTFKQADVLCDDMQKAGLIGGWERSPVDGDSMEDFVDGDLPELDVSIALDGDVTLNAQILLQEQGYRLYPDFGRMGVAYLMQREVSGGGGGGNKGAGAGQQQRVSVIDYYFDTDYNSDPDKFEPKEVLLSVSIENVL